MMTLADELPGLLADYLKQHPNDWGELAPVAGAGQFYDSDLRRIIDCSKDAQAFELASKLLKLPLNQRALAVRRAEFMHWATAFPGSAEERGSLYLGRRSEAYGPASTSEYCNAVDGFQVCTLTPGHDGLHKNGERTWSDQPCGAVYPLDTALHCEKSIWHEGSHIYEDASGPAIWT